MQREKEDPRGRMLPQGYLSRPPVAPENGFLWDAFWDLNTERQIGTPPGPIPVTAIISYAERYGIESVDEFDRFKNMIRAMDTVAREKSEGITAADIRGTALSFDDKQKRAST